MAERRIWAVTFNGAKARAYAVDRAGGRLTPVALAPAEGPKKPAFEDRPATTHQSHGAARGFGESPVTAEQALEVQFVAAVAAGLAAAAADGAFDAVIIAAGPRALGAFRTQADPALARRVLAEVAGDHVNDPPDAFFAAIAPLLKPPLAG